MNKRKVERVDDGVAITLSDGTGGEKTEMFDYLLAATGRRWPSSSPIHRLPPWG